jgi:hypothetical protein
VVKIGPDVPGFQVLFSLPVLHTDTLLYMVSVRANVHIKVHEALQVHATMTPRLYLP